MALIKYQGDFRFGDRKLSDFSGIKYNPNSSGIPYTSMPSPRHNTTTLSNVNGEKYFSTTYDSRTITIPVFIYDDIDIDNFYAWIGKDTPQVFSFIDDFKEIDAILSKGLDISQWYTPSFRGFTEIELICFDPLWRLKKEFPIIYENPVINMIYQFKTVANVKSKPIVKITPNGTQTKIKFKFNDMTITLNNINTEIFIDSYDGEVYKIVNNERVNMFTQYEYISNYEILPVIKPLEENEFILLEGSVKKIEIIPNSRIL